MPTAPLLSKIPSDDEREALRDISLSVVSDVNPEDNSCYAKILAHVLAPMVSQGIASNEYSFFFSRQAFSAAAHPLDVELLKNLGHITYSVRYRSGLSLSIPAIIPEVTNG